MKITVKPRLYKNDMWYRMEIFVDSESRGFLLWIETGNLDKKNTFCKVTDLSFGKPICETIESANSMCEQIQAQIDNGDIV